MQHFYRILFLIPLLAFFIFIWGGISSLVVATCCGQNCSSPQLSVSEIFAKSLLPRQTGPPSSTSALNIHIHHSHSHVVLLSSSHVTLSVSKVSSLAPSMMLLPLSLFFLILSFCILSALVTTYIPLIFVVYNLKFFTPFR